MKLRKIFLVALIAVTVPSVAQDDAMAAAQQTIPEDSAVIVGHLDNGLTYYIRHNDYPKGKVNFYIAQRVGGVQEEDDQDGLAHFLEHMAFNGSKHFPDDSVTKFMNGLGAQWNAFTTADHTVYHVNGVDNGRESALDSCMLLLSDWSEGLTLDEKQLNEQRDVIHNEYRTHGAMQRLFEQALPALFPNSRYGERTVIGSMDVVDHCNSNRLRDYYHKWYFPGNQAIVIVGDIDAKKYEAKVKKLFSTLPVPATAHKAEDLAVADNDSTLYFVGSDKEMSQTFFITFRKDEPLPPQIKQTIPYILYDDVKTLGSQMFNDRMLKLSQQPEAAFTAASSANAEYGMTARTRKSQTVQILPKPGQEAAALKQVLTEMKRAAEYGFTNSELKHAKATYKAALEQQYNNRATITNDTYAQSLIDNFLNNEPYPNIETRYQLDNAILPMLTLEMVNQAIKGEFSIDNENFAVIGLEQQKDGKPVVGLSEMKSIVDEARKATVTAPVDTVKEEPLMPVMPKAGKIVKQKMSKTLGCKELTLSNGARVLLKKTDFKANQILATAIAPGGLAAAKSLNLPSRQMFEQVYSLHGLGTKSVMDLVSLAQTTQTSVDDGISNDLHWINGSTTNENIETLMQEMYLSFQGVKKDEAIYRQMMQYFKGQVANKMDNPDIVIGDSASFYAHSMRHDVLTPSAADIDHIDYDGILNIRKQMFSNAADFTFVFVGSFDEATLRPLIEKYIASLPGKKAKTTVTDQRDYTNGKVSRAFTMAMGNPQSVTRDVYRSAAVPFTLKNYVNAGVLSQVLWNKEFDIIREQESAAYTPMPSAQFDNDLTGSYLLIESELKTNPAKTQRASELADSIVTNTASWVNADDVQKGREALAKSHADAVKTNEYWLSAIEDYAIYGIDRYTDYDKELNAVTPATIGETVKAILSTGNHVRVVMNATKEEGK